MLRQDAPRSADLTKIREDLEELLGTRGWEIFKAHVLNEYRGAGYVARMGTALATKDTVEPQVVHRTALEMVRLLDWPTNKVRDLKGVVEE